MLEHELGFAVYPDRPTSWHYDDKIAQAFPFEALGVPSPTWVWVDRSAALSWGASTSYPKVLKLPERLPRTFASSGMRSRHGAGSSVSSGRAISLDEAQFSRRARLATACVFARGRPTYRVPHHGYALFQGFLTGNPWDTRVTVIGHRAFGYRRYNRPGDFRASGSGRLDCDGVNERFVKLAFKTARLLGAKSCAIDGLWDGERPVTSEISYTYVSRYVGDCPGHWALDGDPDEGPLRWIPGPMSPEEAQVEDFLVRLGQRAGR